NGIMHDMNIMGGTENATVGGRDADDYDNDEFNFHDNGLEKAKLTKGEQRILQTLKSCVETWRRVG
ncbi:hypothetical protein KEM54_003705, partial [Ascosphaera aggregata]